MNAENSPHTCPQCSAPLPPEAPHGLCPKCLLAGVAAATEGSSRPEAPSLEEIAAAFPQLEVQTLIGAGGMGAVYRARQPHLERLVALKVLPAALAERDPAFAERFMREGRLLARLSHPNIVSVHDFGQAGAFYYLVMEYVDGVNLREAMQAGRFTPEQALGLVPHICDALQYAHDEGVLHRDIKPENILLDTKGRVKLADFGIAKLADERTARTSITATGTQLGTPAYMAPEQIEQPSAVDHRADIYSLGVVFYEMLTGELPLGRFAAPSKKTPMDTRIDDIVLRALAKERELRQQSATEMKTQVERVTDTPPIDPDTWMIRCDTCGRTSTLASVGALRIGAASIGKRTLIRCSQCGKLRMGVIAKLKDLPPGTVPVVPDPAGAPRWPLWKVALVIAALSLPIALLIAALAIPAVQTIPAVQKNGGSLWLGLLPLVIIPTGVFCFAMALGWFYRTLVRVGAPRWLATLLLLVVLLIVPPAGCVAMYLGAHSPRRVSPLFLSNPKDFVLNPKHGSQSLESVDARWGVRSEAPGWVIVRFMGGQHAVELRRDKEGIYSAEINARLALQRTPANWARLELKVSDGRGRAANTDASFAEPPEEWFPKVFSDTVKSGAHPRGTYPLMRIGMHVVTLTLADQQPAEAKGSTCLTGRDVKVSLKDRGLTVELECDENAPDGVVAVGDSAGLARPKRIVQEAAADAPRRRVRWIWENPADLDEAGRVALLEHLKANFLGRAVFISNGEKLTIFTIPTIEGDHAEGLLRAEPPDVLHEEAIRLARERLEGTRQRIAVGVAPSSDEAFAKMELAIAEARGDAVKIAIAKVAYHEEFSKGVAARMEAGLVSQDEKSRAEAELLAAKIELETARRSAPLKP